MAPGLVMDESPQTSARAWKNENAPRSIFPDGIRTSGQHPPLYDVLRPYSDFPTEIVGPTVWHREQFADRPEAWTHPFTDDEIRELSGAADAFIASGTALTGISQVRVYGRNIV